MFPLPEDIEHFAFEGFEIERCQRWVSPKVNLHPAAASLLQGLPVAIVGTRPEALMCFVDGSFVGTSATWAVAFIGLHLGQWCWFGYRSGPLPSQLEAGSVFPAEVFAQFVALGTIASCEVPGAVFYDSQSAALVAHAATSQVAQDPLTAAAASLTAYIRVQCRQLAFVYTKAHEHHPGNELADSLAVAAHKVPSTAAAFDFDVARDILGRSYEWLWLRPAARNHPAWPSLNDDGATVPCVRAPAGVHSTPAAWAALPENAPATSRACIQAEILTYNTLSCRTSLQRHCLQTFMLGRRASVLALQETRQDADPISQVGPIIRVASQPDQGQLGCQLWLNTASRMQFAMRRTAILHSSPRVLIVLASTPVAKICFVVAHAPTSASTSDSIEGWWAALAARLQALPAGATPIVCLDANARYRLDGLHGEVPENQNAVCLDSFCQRFSLYRSRAYTPAGRGIKTWTSPNGAPACLDYILCPDTWAEHTNTLTDLGLLDAHSGIDHDIVGLQVSFEVEHCPKPPCVDTRAMLQPAGRRAVTTLFQQVPLCPWNMPSDDHLRVVQQHLVQGMQALFSQQQVLPRRPVLSTATWELLRVKRWARRVFRRRAGLQARRVLHACLSAWRYARTGQATTPAVDPARFDHQAAAYIHFMRSLAGLIRDSTQRDEATFAREHLRTARHQGADAMAAAIRAVLKHGRRFKPPGRPSTCAFTMSL